MNTPANCQPRKPSGTPAGGQFDASTGGGAATGLGSFDDEPAARDHADGLRREFRAHGVGAGAITGMDPQAARTLLDDARADQPGWVSQQVADYWRRAEAPLAGHVTVERAETLARQAAEQRAAAETEHARAYADIASCQAGGAPAEAQRRMRLAARDLDAALRRDTRARFDLAALKGEAADDTWEGLSVDQARARLVDPAYRGALRSTTPTPPAGP